MRFERVTVYVDLASEADFLGTVTECARRLAPECVVISQKEILATPPPTAAEGVVKSQQNEKVISSSRRETTVGLIRLWQAEEADVYTRDVNNSVLFMNAAELLITDKNAADGAVTYAMYRRQMPVLSLAATHLPARTALHQLLYAGNTGETVEERKEGIQQFLTFPAARGVYTVASSISTAAVNVAAVRVVVNADGYPVQLKHPSNDDHSGSSGNGLLPPPPTLFANALEELLCSSSENIAVLRRRNPTLPGVLEAFHRYQNRGVMRAMLHRGYRVEVAPEPESSGLRWVEKFVALEESDEQTQTEKMVAAEAMLAKFESHWLELPLAEKST